MQPKTFNDVANLVEIGAKRVTQTSGTLFAFLDKTGSETSLENAEAICACSMGALWVGMCVNENEDIIEVLRGPEGGVAWESNFYPYYLPNKEVSCPVSKHEGQGGNWQRMAVEDALVHLNDDHSWTFDQIIKWLRSLDAKA